MFNVKSFCGLTYGLAHCDRARILLVFYYSCITVQLYSNIRKELYTYFAFTRKRNPSLLSVRSAERGTRMGCILNAVFSYIEICIRIKIKNKCTTENTRENIATFSFQFFLE